MTTYYIIIFFVRQSIVNSPARARVCVCASTALWYIVVVVIDGTGEGGGETFRRAGVAAADAHDV